MMNEVFVCAHKIEYKGGDTVFGVVYVKIDAPTGATGVSLKICGYETYYYSVEDNNDGDEIHRVIQDTKDHLPCETVLLCKCEGPIPFGQYAFPFRIQLQKRIPGSMQAWSSAPQWRACIEYRIEAELIGSEDIKGSVDLNVVEESIKFSKTVDDYIIVKGPFPLQKATVTVCASLDKEVYYVGDVCKLTVDFHKSGFFNPVVENIKMKLVQNLVLELRTSAHNKQDMVELAGPRPGLLSRLLCSTDRGKSAHLMGNLVQLEGGHVVLWQGEIDDSNRQLKLIRGLQNFLIPLKSPDTRPLPPTTFGKHIFCGYWLEIDITINGAVLQMNVPVPYVRKKITPGSTAEPIWARQCRLGEANYKYSLSPDTELSNLSTLPCLHELLTKQTSKS